MSLTPYREKARESHLTATDVVKLFSGGAYDLWLRKTGKLETQEPEESEAMRLGVLLEPALLAAAEREIGKLMRNQYRVHSGGILSCTHDALVVGKLEGVEAKTTGIVNPRFEGGDWGDQGTDQVPERVLIQTAVQMIVSGLEQVHVVAWIRGKGEVLYHVARNNDLVDIIMDKVMLFWGRSVLADIPPADSLPTIEIARLRIRQTGKTISLPPDRVALWRDQKQAAKEATAAADATERELLAAMEDAELGQTNLGLQVRVISGTSKWIDAAALRADLPDVAMKYERTKSFKYPRIEKGQKT